MKYVLTFVALVLLVCVGLYVGALAVGAWVL